MTLYWPTASQVIAAGGGYLAARPGHVPPVHQGCDIRIGAGTPTYASGDGVVSAVINTGTHAGFGLYVQVEYPGGVQVRTAHMSRADVSAGQRVTVTTQLGLSGGKAGTFGAGDSTGPHCHCETHLNGRLANPFDLLANRSTIAGGGATPIPTPPIERDDMLKFIYDVDGNVQYLTSEGGAGLVHVPYHDHAVILQNFILGTSEFSLSELKVLTGYFNALRTGAGEATIPA